MLGLGDQHKCETHSNIGEETVQTLIHDAWYVEWQASDELPLKLPELPLGSSVASWAPGETATPIPPYNLVRDNSINGTQITIIATVIPVVVVGFLAAACVFCIRKNRKLKRQEQQKSLQQISEQQEAHEMTERQSSNASVDK